MIDTIHLEGLRVLGVHGALDFERTHSQPFDVDLLIETDFAAAIASDQLVDAIDYGVVVDRVRSVVEKKSFVLLESLADAIASLVLEDARVRAVTVSLRKLRPPVEADLGSAGVVLERRRSS